MWVLTVETVAVCCVARVLAVRLEACVEEVCIVVSVIMRGQSDAVETVEAWRTVVDTEAVLTWRVPRAVIVAEALRRV